jgi:hypothetical protein
MPWFGVSTGFCALWAWISPRRTGRPGSHCGTQAALISGAHPEPRLYGVLPADWQGRKKVTQRPGDLLIWHFFLSELQGTFQHGDECLKKLPWFTSVSGYSWSFGAAERYFPWMKAQKITYTRILNIHGTYPCCGWVCVCVWARGCLWTISCFSVY